MIKRGALASRLSVNENGLVSTHLPEPVNAPDGQTYVVRIYRAGTMARYPSTENTPSPGGVLRLPLLLFGLVLHLLVFRRRWTVRVAPWHNLPGKRHREWADSQSSAGTRADVLRRALESGAWQPGCGPAPEE